MNRVDALSFANLFFAGILAGMEMAIHYGLHGPTRALSEPSQVRLRQGLVLRLRILVPGFFVPAAASGIAVVILDGAQPGLWFRGAGVVVAFASFLAAEALKLAPH